MKALEQTPAVLEVAVFGRGLHVSVRRTEDADAQIRASLRAKGIEIRSLEVIQPSMEDVFVALIEEEEKKAS